MIAKYDKDHGPAEEKSVPSKSVKPEKKKAKAKEDSPQEDHPPKGGADKKKPSGKAAQIEEETFEARLEVLKRTTMDSEIIFKVFDPASKKEQFMSRQELLKEDPVALCLFYEKHIVS